MIPTVRVAIDEENPWPGLGSFDETAERFFNGRRTESAELRRLVVHAPLTVLFGASGLGKTSLLQAGLFPTLRKERFVPIYIRLDVRDESAPLIEQLKFALQAQFDARRIDAAAIHKDESLWSYLHRAGLELWSEQNQLLTPVFVLDQFEEVFTLGAENPAAIARLRVDLADLIENRLPAELARNLAQNEDAGDELSLDSQHYKVILSFREDFLPAVEGWKREVPSILRNRLRLLPMSGEQAFEAVHTTASQLVDEPLARDIVRFVAAAQEHGAARGDQTDGLKDLAVEPALLSLVCHGLNEKRKAQHKRTFDAALLSGTGQAVIKDYYDNAVGDFPERVQRFIENELITERGFRKPCDVDDARSIHGVTDRELSLLVDRRLLRIEPQRGTERVELTHDLLTSVVREHRNTQRERARIRRQRRRMALVGAVGAVLVALVVVFGRLYFDANAQRRIAQQAQLTAETERKNALIQTDRAQKALKANEEFSGKLNTQRGIAEAAAHDANVARQDAEQQAAIAAGRRLATEALYRFDSSAEGLAVSGALAALSLKVAPSSEAWKALAQVLRLIPTTPEILPKAHPGPVQSLTFSHDGRWMASAGHGTIVLWDLSNHMKKTELEGRLDIPASGFGLALAHDGQWLAVGAMDSLSIWKTATAARTEIPSNDGLMRSVTFSPDGQHMATASRNSGVVRLFERIGDRWNELPGFVTTTTAYKANSVIFVANNMLALAGTYGSPYQHSVWFWDLAQKKETFLRGSNRNENFGECRALTLSHDSQTLAALCSRGIFVADREETSFSPSDRAREDSGSFSVSWGISLSNDGRYIAAVDNGGVVHVFGNRTEQEISRMTRQSKSVAFRPDGRLMAAGLADGSIALWPTTKGTESIRLPSESPTSALAFSPDEQWLVLAGKDETIRVLDISDVSKSRKIQSFRIGSDLGRPEFSPNGRFLVVPGTTAVHLIQTHPWKRLSQDDLPGKITAASFSPDSRLLVTQGAEGIRSFETATWKQTKPSIAGSFQTIKFSPDGRFLAAFSQRRGKGRYFVHLIEVWNAATGVEVAWREEGRQPSDGPAPRPVQGGDQRLISASEKWTNAAERSVSQDGALKVDTDRLALELKEATSGRTIARLEHDTDIVDAAFSPHGRWLATSSKDGTIRLWPLQPKDLLDQACKLLPRNLTPDEWKELKLNGPYRKTCPNLP